MLKITTVREDNKTATLMVDGTISDVCLTDLETLCRHYISEKKQVFLDLRGVTFIDRKGLTLLKKLQSYGVDVVSSTLYINSLLNLAGDKLPDYHKD